jgi:hypothetical protein
MRTHVGGESRVTIWRQTPAFFILKIGKDVVILVAKKFGTYNEARGQ